MSALADQIAGLYKAGVEIILVSSGAVALGRSEVHTRGTGTHHERELRYPTALPQPK